MVLIDFDKESIRRSMTSEDLAQDKILAELEAQEKFRILGEALKRVS